MPEQSRTPGTRPGFTLLGVIDVRDGRAVHARAGRRDRYEPIETSAGLPVAGDPLALARVYVEYLGVGELYVADLDAIGGRPRRDGLIERLANIGVPMAIDAGITTVDAARATLDAGATSVVVGLETLPSFDVLHEIGAAAGGDRVTFSLDLRDGVPIVSPAMRTEEPVEMARLAIEAGVAAVIVLDLARVGMGAGVDAALVARIRALAPRVRLLAGGGVRDADDLRGLREAGCDGALVATALHAGRLRGGWLHGGSLADGRLRGVTAAPADRHGRLTR